MDVEEFLEHHGVKGQRWGIRTDPSQKVAISKVNDFLKRDSSTGAKVSDILVVHGGDLFVNLGGTG